MQLRLSLNIDSLQLGVSFRVLRKFSWPIALPPGYWVIFGGGLLRSPLSNFQDNYLVRMLSNASEKFLLA